MVIKYPVNTVSQHDAISIAQAMAKSHGFNRMVTISVQRTAPNEWMITLDVSK